MSPTFSVRFNRPALVAACALLASGCAGLAPLPEDRGVAELTGVPFFPQTEYDCGPAALATILNDAGVAVTPAELIDAVYIEGLRGSLQAELLGASRRHGLLPVPIEPGPDALIDEIASGRPVLVLQNLGIKRVPVWHYAVVVGYSAERQRVVLRSGDEERRMQRAKRFLRTWDRAENWGFVVVEPGEVPAAASPDNYMRALVGSSEQLRDASVAAAYAAALERWPDDPLVLFLSASRRQSEQRLESAASLYRRLIELEPEHAAARNNLAHILLEQGCRGQALREARAARALQSPRDPLNGAIAETVREIETAPGDESSACS